MTPHLLVMVLYYLAVHLADCRRPSKWAASQRATKCRHARFLDPRRLASDAARIYKIARCTRRISRTVPADSAMERMGLYCVLIVARERTSASAFPSKGD
jgi:hypothetical protein